MIGHPNFSRRWVLSGLLAGVAVPGCAEAPNRSIRPNARASATLSKAQAPDRGAQAFVDAAKLGGTVGYLVVETQSGKVLEAINADTALPPASVAKAMTTLFALNRLGPSHRFTTRVIGTGPVSGGRLQGDLILVGSGDPTLDTDRLGDLAAALAARGVRDVSGRFLIHAGSVPHLTEIDRDQPDYVGYNPAISGLNLNYNRVNFEWRRGAKGVELSMDARGKRFMPKVAMSRVRAVDRDAPLFAYSRGEGRDDWTVAARALGKPGSRWLPVRHPEAYTAEVFATLMRAHGLTLPPAQTVASLPAGVMLAEVRSAELLVVARDMLRFSTNITAEVVGLTASGGRTLADSARQMTDWASQTLGVQARFVDHSGLGGASRIAASQMVAALRAGRASGLASILREQGMRDAAGNDMKGNPVRVAAKTGTLNFASGLAGYIQPPSGRELTFAIFSADTARRDRLGRAEREQPEGGQAWTRRARKMQGQLLGRWAALYT